MTKFVQILCVTLIMMMIAGCAYAGAPTDPALNPIGTLPLVKEDTTITFGLIQSSYVLDFEENALTKMIEEKTGLNIEFKIYPEVDAETKLMMDVIAGAELPDVLCFGIKDATLRNQLANAGALLALDDFFDAETGIADQYYAACEKHGVDPAFPINMLRSADGKIYCMPTYGQYLTTMYDYRAYINQDWLDVLGLEVPTTIDELTQVLIAFRDGDPNGNGIKDEIPMTGADAKNLSSIDNPMTWLQDLFIYRDKSNNLYLPLSDTDGKLDVSYDKEEYREMLKYVNMLVREDLLDEAAFTQTRSEMRAQLQADVQTIGMMFGSANGFGQNIGSWTPIEMPVGYYGKQIVTVGAPVPGTTWSITTACKNPEVAFLLASLGYDDSLGDYFWVYSARFGEKDVDWKYAQEGDVSILQELDIKPSLQVLNITWGTESTSHWQEVAFPYIFSGSYAIEVFDGNEAYGERLHGRSVAMNIKHAPDPSDVVPNSLLYTDEERDEWDEVRSALKSYLTEAEALFAVGQYDPNSDADWNNFLNELEVLRYKELLELDQVVYNRTMGIE